MEVRTSREKLDNALSNVRDMHPLPTNAGFDAAGFMKDGEAWDALMDYIAVGNSVRAFTKELDLPNAATTKLNRYLAKIKPGHPRFEDYAEARIARAHQFAEKMLNIVMEVEVGTMTTQQGSMTVKTLQWLAERIAPEHFSGRISIDATLKVSNADMHLEAVRLMSEMVKDGEAGSVYQGEVVHKIPGPIEDPYELLE